MGWALTILISFVIGRASGRKQMIDLMAKEFDKQCDKVIADGMAAMKRANAAYDEILAMLQNRR